MSKITSIVCFGEVLWDMLPTGKVVGGAPLNVAFHAQNFGLDAKVISSIGADKLGEELLDFLDQKGVSRQLIQINQSYPTSTVEVTLNESGSASYEIVAPVAWDFIESNPASIRAVENAKLLLFGSLICRSQSNIKTLNELINKASKTVFDVNLRPPFYNQALIEDLLHKADIVKMNDEELAIIIDWQNKAGTLEEQMTFLMNRFKMETLIMTNGKQGAYCMHNGVLYFHKSFPIQVKDTVGSGDSFLAAFLTRMLEEQSWENCLAFASATGGLVATKSGGTPEINKNLVEEFMTKKS